MPEWQEIWPKRLAEAAKTDGPILTEDTYNPADGSIRYADAATTAICNVSGDLLFYLVQASDTLGEIAEAVLNELGVSQPGRRVEFILGGNMPVRGDARLLRVMLDNLLGIAWKFTARKAISQLIC